MVCIESRHVFFDIDGTIAENDNPPSRLTVYALRSLRKCGHMIFICTGRTLCDIYPEITLIGFDGIISGAGANITVGRRTIFRRAIPKTLLNITAGKMLKAGITCVLEGHSQMYILDGKVTYDWPTIKVHISRPEQLASLENIEKLTLHTSDGMQIERVFTFLRRFYDIYEHPETGFYELVLKGCDKGAAVDRVLRFDRALRKDAVAFGDSRNDCSMFRSVGTSVSMGNAPLALKEMSSVVTGTIKQEGVYNALVNMRMIPPNKMRRQP